MIVPNLQREQALWKSGRLRVVGVDEAGLGPLAGPVVAVAYQPPAGRPMIEGVRDSKTLSSSQRERLVEAILQRGVAVGIGAASVAEIERLNVLKATHLAMRRALMRVGAFDHALIDGRDLAGLDWCPHTALVDGDALSYSIACASILAKVTRDRLMRRLSARYPGYGWERNAGYGTEQHLEALRRLGLTPLHRRTYAPVRAVLTQLALPLEMQRRCSSASLRAGRHPAGES